jgi:hypothetical protein
MGVMKKSKKAALLLAVMGLNNLPITMDNSLTGEYFSVNRAEAADEVHALSDAERIARGYPKIPNVTYYSNGSVDVSYSASMWRGI